METTAPTAPEKVAEVMLAYYRQADTLPATCTELLWWVERLSPTAKAEVYTVGREVWFLPAFKRFLLERRGYSMRAYMDGHHTPAELAFWVDDNDRGVRAA